MGVAEPWSGREAAALRQAHRMSIRAYAAHLGVAIATVANWDSRRAPECSGNVRIVMGCRRG
jgi:DNA-binding transcriptional regulator YiaG